MRSTEVCSTTFRQDLLLHLLNLYNITSAVAALQAATQVDVACRLFCVMRDGYLAIHRPVHFVSPAAAGIVCYTACIRLAGESEPNVHWLEEVVNPVAQRFGEWASAPCTVSTITDLLAVVQREVARLLVLMF